MQRTRLLWRNPTVYLAAVATLSGVVAASHAESVDYNRDVRPILSAHCFECHGPDPGHRQAELRLDLAESALEDRGGYAAVVPGQPDESELIARVTSDDPDLRMPPDELHRPLSAEQIDTLRQWIAEGAPYAQHWSFIPAERPEVPADPSGWAQGPIDRFVARRLREAGFEPAPEADRAALCRRVTLDLTGLPPTAAEVQAFVADPRDDAYARLVDRLLASPHYGERMAIPWLDAARYADTNGFSIDGGRHMWLWRDWVINAFNQNLPYDEFLVQQLAGDLLPDPSDAMLIATGFQRNNMVTHEGGTIPAENLLNYNADRVKTLGEAVLGLTLGCAQCHDHKYDPITQREYYQLFAYFNTIGDRGLDGNAGVNPAPSKKLRTVLQHDDLEAIGTRIAELRRQLDHPDPERVEAWAADQRRLQQQRGVDFELHPIRLTGVTTPNAGDGFEIRDDRLVMITRAPGFAAYDVTGVLPAADKPVTGLRVVFHPASADEPSNWGHGKPAEVGGDAADERETGMFVVTTFSASVGSAESLQVNLHRLLPLAQVTASSWTEGFRPERVRDTRRTNGWAPAVDRQGPVHLTVTFDEPIDPGSTPHLTTQLNYGYGSQLVPRKVELLAMTGTDDGSSLPDDLQQIIATERSERTEEQQRRLDTYYAAIAEPTERLRIELTNLEERQRTLTEPMPTMVMQEAEKPRTTRILNRGDYQQPGEAVSAATPAMLPPLPEGASANRLGLARWITMREHPLTARVAVNRTWSLFFGRGLTNTLADLGAQGEYPSHPDLLDWLAVDWMESGWDQKALVRQIVLSATYRQSSVPTPDELARDPENRLLARGPRFRLPAEFIRDAALKVSGLLVPRLGGPSVNPYAPGDLWREVSHYGSTPATAQSYVQDHGEKLYRRSLYTYWKRTSPPPNLAVLDAPSRETCVVSRPETITPLQALVLLNDPTFVEASRVFAEQIVASRDDAAERIRWACWEALSRAPSGEEASQLLTLLEQQEARFAADRQAAEALLSVGESPRDTSIDLVEHAAWSQVATVLLNMSETITRN